MLNAIGQFSVLMKKNELGCCREFLNDLCTVVAFISLTVFIGAVFIITVLLFVSITSPPVYAYKHASKKPRHPFEKLRKPVQSPIDQVYDPLSKGFFIDEITRMSNSLIIEGEPVHFSEPIWVDYCATGEKPEELKVLDVKINKLEEEIRKLKEK